VVVFGTSESCLGKAMVLSFHHCANLGNFNDWNVAVWHNDTMGEGMGHWRKMAVLGQESINTPCYTQLEAKKVYLLTDLPGRYALVGQSRANCSAFKNLKLAIFAPEILSSDYSLRVYCIEDTKDSLEVKRTFFIQVIPFCQYANKYLHKKPHKFNKKKFVTRNSYFQDIDGLIK
jgi:netrin receptor unc-5